MRPRQFRIDVQDHLYESGREVAVKIDRGDCVVQVSRAGDLASICRALMGLGIDIGIATITAVPVALE